MLDFIPETLVSSQWRWLLTIAIDIGIACFLSIVLCRTGSWITKKVEKKKGAASLGLAQIVDSILFPPLLFLIWSMVCINTAALIGFHYKVESVLKYIVPVRGSAIVLAIAWMLLRWINAGFRQLRRNATHFGIAVGTLYALNRLFSSVIFILALLTIFQIFGLNILPLLTFGGIGVAGIAFAAQDIIANFFGGAMLHFTGSFSPGDYIVIPSSNGFEGTVKEIGWYITMIEDNTKRPVYFPNALFSKTHIINESRRSHRCIKEVVVLSYEDLSLLESIIGAVREELKGHPQVDLTQYFSITLNKFEGEGIELSIHLFVYKMGYVEYMKTRQEVLLLVKKAVEGQGGILGPAITQINLTKDSKGLR